MGDVRGDLARLRDRQLPEPGAFDRLAHRRRSLHLRRRLGTGILAIVIAGGGLGALMRAFDGNGKPATSPSPAPSIGGGDSLTVKMVASGKAMVDTQRAIYTLGGSTDPTTWRKAAHVGMDRASRPATFQLIDGSWDGWQLWRARSGSDRLHRMMDSGRPDRTVDGPIGRQTTTSESA